MDLDVHGSGAEEVTSLTKQATSGVTWVSISTAIITGLQVLQLVILARLLAPDDFGLMAMVLVVMGLARAFGDMGLSNAIIYRQDTTREQLSSLYWMNILAGGLVFAIVWASTPLVIDFYREPRLAPLMFWAALNFMIVSTGQQFQILLEKELRFDRLAKIEIVAAAISMGVTTGLAASGHGVFSLIWGLLTNTSIKAILLSCSSWREWRPGLRLKREDLDGYIGFGIYQMGEQTINYFNMTIDQLVIGSVLGAQSLGYYNMSVTLTDWPRIVINPILTRVCFPLFAKIQYDTERLKHGYLTLMKVLSMVNGPLLLGLAAVAPDFVQVLFGKQWLAVVPLVQILTIVGLLRSQGNPVGALLLAKGRADLAFKWNLLVVVTQLPLLYVGAHLGGLLGVAITLVSMNIVFSVLNYLLLIRTMIGPCLRGYAASIVPALLLSIGMAIIIRAVDLIIHMHYELHGLPVLIGEAVLGGIVFLGLALLIMKREVEQVREIVLGRIGRTH